MIFIFGDSYCDSNYHNRAFGPINTDGYKERQGKTWLRYIGQRLDQKINCLGLIGTCIDYSINQVIKVRDEILKDKNNIVIFHETNYDRIKFKFIKDPRHTSITKWDFKTNNFDANRWLQEPGMQYVKKHRKFVEYFHNNYKEENKRLKTRCVLFALSRHIGKVIYLSNEKDYDDNIHNSFSPNDHKFINPPISLFKISRQEFKDETRDGFRDVRMNHLSDANHEIMTTYIQRLILNQNVDDIKFEENII